MSTSLPQEVQTSKFKSLPSDLKDIVEELLKEKFGVDEPAPRFREEVRPRDDYVSYNQRRSVFTIAIGEASVSALYYAIKRTFELRRNASSNMMRLEASMSFLNRLMEDSVRLGHPIYDEYMNTMFGVKIKVVDSHVLGPYAKLVLEL